MSDWDEFKLSPPQRSWFRKNRLGGAEFTRAMGVYQQARRMRQSGVLEREVLAFMGISGDLKKFPAIFYGWGVE